MQQWLDENIAEQITRYEAIVKEMDELEPQRVEWYKEFLDTVQNKGFNFDGDLTRKIPDSELPVEPDRKHKVIF